MLFNKNEVRKANEKKVLHKSGKNWIVLSSALLLALAGGAAVSSQTSANADNTNNNGQEVAQNEQNFLNNVDQNNNITTGNNSTIHSLVGNSLVNAPASSANSKASAKSASSASSQWYWKWNGGSAASYKAQASSDANTASNDQKIVNSYVKSVNAHFPSATSSLNASLGNAQSKLGNDKSLAASYSAIANNSNYSSEVSSLAASAGMTYSAYVQSVGYTASYNASEVSSASDAASQMNVANSYAQEINNIWNNSASKQDIYADQNSADNALFAAGRYYSNASAALSAYNLAIGNSKADSLAEKVALNDSVMDAGYVQSIANQLGAPSAVVSNEVRSLATSANAIGTTTTPTISSGNDASNFADNHYVVNASSDGHSHYTFSTYYINNADNNGNIVFSANNKSAAVSDYNPDLVRVVSNTAVMNGFNSNVAMNSSEIARYNSASAALNAAKVAYDDARTTANTYDVLAKAASAPTSSAALGYIFGNGKSNAASLLDRGSYADAYNIINNASSSASNAATGSEVVASLSDELNFYTTNSNTSSSASTSASSYASVTSGANSFVAALRTAWSNGSSASSAYSWIANSLSQYHVDGTLDNDMKSAARTVAGNSAASLVYIAVSNAESNYLNGFTSASSQANLDWTVAGAIYNNVAYNDAHVFNGDNNASRVASDVSQASSATLSEKASVGVAGNNEAEHVAGAMSGAANRAAGKVTYKPYTTVLDTADEISSATSDVNSEYAAESANSASYANSKDANIVLANSYAESYAGKLSDDNEAVSAANNSLQDFYVDHAGSSYASAEYQASSASDASINDAALAQAYGINVYNNVPKYIRAIKGVRVHTDTNFGSKADSIKGNIPAGDEMTVEGIGLDAHGALRYNIYFHGNNYFVSGNDNYVTPTFLAAENNVSIVVNKPAREYTSTDFNAKTATGKTLAANAQVSGDIIRMDNFNNGFTRVHLSNGNYITANTNYVAKVANNDDVQNNINGQNIHHYINNANNNDNNNDAPITWGI